MTISPDSPAPAEWQVTCVCGWRVHGAKEIIVAAVQEHGRTTHGLTLSEADVMAQAVPVGPGREG